MMIVSCAANTSSPAGARRPQGHRATAHSTHLTSPAHPRFCICTCTLNPVRHDATLAQSSALR
ncbi:hypothetical protein EJ04DRAFT_517033 [Polyplosphaeria fusca]|uniref:Uncharacterized protein n=1 Tax=Polyplosphaeria fusca TaxID=682080 RepID=A0A9P4QLB1_9PLEO|nr:hypothetical protein EJ04DRAFT_517033 [Polyplosphaeria fusca]